MGHAWTSADGASRTLATADKSTEVGASAKLSRASRNQRDCEGFRMTAWQKTGHVAMLAATLAARMIAGQIKSEATPKLKHDRAHGDILGLG